MRVDKSRIFIRISAIAGVLRDLWKSAEGKKMPERKHIRLEQVGDVSVITLVGSKWVDRGVIDEMGVELYSLVDQEGLKKILVNLDGVEYLASQALGKLIALQKKSDNSGGKVILCNIDPVVYEVLEITRLDKFFRIEKTERAALEVFS